MNLCRLAGISRALRRCAIALLLCLCAAGAQAQPAAGQADRDLAAVLDFEHGLERLGPAERERVGRLLRDPAAAIAAVRRVVPQLDARRLPDPAYLMRVGRAAALLSRLDDDAARELLATWYEQLAAAPMRDAKNAPLLRTTVLDAFTTRPAPRVTADLLGNIETFDYATRVAALGYLVRVERGNPAVRDKLRRLTRDPRSPLHKDAAALGALRAIGGDGS